MCRDDRQYGRNSGSRYASQAVGTTAVPLCQPNLDRLAIIISAPSANRVTIGTDPLLADLTGIVLYATGAPLVLDLNHHGDIVTTGLWAISNAGTNTIGYVEVIGEQE